MAGTSKKGYERGWPEQRDGWRSSRMEEEVSNNGGPWRARMNSRAPRQKEKKKKIYITKEQKMTLYSYISTNISICTALLITNI